jgi:serine/threonine protein phosphatase 1
MREKLQPVRRFGPNPRGGRDLIVGDIHGWYMRLRDALMAVGFDFTRDRLFAVGDLCDRGPESPDALAWLQEPWFHAVRGNHEEMLLDYAAGRAPAQYFAANGGAWFVGMLPQERQPFIDAFEALPYAITLETGAGDVGIVHADCPLRSWGAFTAALWAPQPPPRFMQDLARVEVACVWSRNRFDFADADCVAGVRAVVVGHNETPRLVRYGNVVHIDTNRPTGRFTIIDAATLEPAVAPSRLDWSAAGG